MGVTEGLKTNKLSEGMGSTRFAYFFRSYLKDRVSVAAIVLLSVMWRLES